MKHGRRVRGVACLAPGRLDLKTIPGGDRIEGESKPRLRVSRALCAGAVQAMCLASEALGTSPWEPLPPKATNLGDQMNPTKVHGSSIPKTHGSIEVYRVLDAKFGVRLVPQGKIPEFRPSGTKSSGHAALVERRSATPTMRESKTWGSAAPGPLN